MKPSTQTDAVGSDLLHGPVASRLLTFSLPFMVSTLLQTLYSTTDTVIVGQCLGSSGLSAVSNGSQLMQMISMICVGFSTAGQVLIAQSVGAGNTGKIRQIVESLVYLVIGLSVALGVFCVALCDVLLTALNTPVEAYEQARYYVIICGCGTIFTGLYNMFSAIFRGLGDSRHPLLFVFIASVINIILDLLFVAVLGWNVAGAALATLLGQLASVVFSVVYLYRNPKLLPFPFRILEMRPHRETAGQITKIGIPLAIQSAAVQFSFLFVSGMVNTLGVDVSAAFGVAQKLRNVPGVLTQGLGLGTSSMIGQNLGAGNQKRVSQTINWCLLFTTIVNALFGVAFALTPVLCFRMFTQDEAVLAYAGMCMFTLVIELPGRCLMPGCNALVSAQGFVKFSMTVAFLDAFAGRVLLCWLLGIVLDMGAMGFFLGYSLATYITAIPVFVYYISGLWKRRSNLVSRAD